TAPSPTTASPYNKKSQKHLRRGEANLETTTSTPPPAPVIPEPPFHSRQSPDSSGPRATSSYLHEENCVTITREGLQDSSGVSSLEPRSCPPGYYCANMKKRKALSAATTTCGPE
ncbi:hypothetical protein AVEN_244272-2-1, partial [Araneus ventricosus]